MNANNRNEQRKLWNHKLKEAGSDARYIVEAEGIWVESEQPWICSEEVYIESEELANIEEDEVMEVMEAAEVAEESEVMKIVEVAEEDWKKDWVEDWREVPAEDVDAIWDMLVEKTDEDIENDILEAWSGTTYS